MSNIDKAAEHLGANALKMIKLILLKHDAAIIEASLEATQTLRDGLQTAIWRLEDMLKGDDGQAWKEAEKALPKLKKILEES